MAAPSPRRTLLVVLFALVTLGVVGAPSIAAAQQLRLTWIDNSGGQAGFVIQRALGATGTYSQIAQVPSGVATYTDTAVSLGTTYCYRVAAFNGAGMSAFTNPACGSPSGGVTLTIAKAGSGTGTVTSSPAGISCGSICSYTYLLGRLVTLTATPSAGSVFSGWSGGGCSGILSCALAGNVSTTVTATFSAAGASITVGSITPNQGSPGAAVSVTVLGSGFVSGTTVSISGAGVTASNVAVVSSTQLSATLTIASSAALGARNVTVTKSGASATLASGFTVKSAGSATLTLVYNGKLRDRVGQGNTALGADGALDGTLTATLSATGGRTVTSLRLESTGPGTWDTTSASEFWVLGVASSETGPLLNAPGTMAVNFPVANGGSFVVFASDYQGTEFLSGKTLTLTATFSDGSTATAMTTAGGAPTLSLAYNGKLRDRVGQGNTALSADGTLDGTLTATLSATGGRTVTGLRLDSTGPGTWDTTGGSEFWVLGVASSQTGPLLNAPGTMAVNFTVANGGSFVLFASDYQAMEFLPGRRLTLTATFSDGSTATAAMTVP